MLFNSFEYVLFLWTVYVLFWTLRTRRKLRHTMLLVASYWFYAQADWRFLSLLVVSSLVDFWAGRGVHDALEAGNRRRAHAFLGLSLAVNLGLLGTFKYADFFLGGFSDLAQAVGLDPIGLRLDLVLPVGISFYTFQTLSYTFDIYRGKLRPIASLLDFSLYVSFFPQLVAGPIVRAIQFLPQLEQPPEYDDRRVSSGLFQILRGLVKKLLMADVLGAHLVDAAFADADTMGQLGAPALLLATYAYALQLYGDFAGYSDIAIGSARLLGFELPKNFDAPFKSRSLEEFWTRWHITMSSWFMDYVYVGLGGSRVGFWRYARNVIVAWGLVGLWHGAAWTFALWGLYHGLWLVAVRCVRMLLPDERLPQNKLFAVLGVLFTFHVVAFSMILFRCPDLATFSSAVAQLGDWSMGLPNVPWQIWLVLGLGYASHLMPDAWQQALERGWEATPRVVQGLALAASMVLLFALHPPGLAPFIYFQF
ncbi:MBOAT family O-acyltransferase [Engelhardtia mirabilis]|uniref:Peptidoglycan O-acetyltransferase n=1 Tax=Engelhardtia mirabilis TaxID=2528011 RepID=A0A518BKW2_9BACT|nr:Peptidoglycan O-acetyltransferase [Planctomycetes bacterium Pla133]QDV01932.1 Peptidoglycan O-acetyltransferase [Planctomycetes bacterium Pla86]